MPRSINASDWSSATQHARDAARALYLLGVAAATQGIRIRYQAASVYLNVAGLRYGGRRSVLPLDALAALCAKLGTPDLSALFWSDETYDLVDSADPRSLPRWRNARDKLREEARCYAYSGWVTRSPFGAE